MTGEGSDTKAFTQSVIAVKIAILKMGTTSHFLHPIVDEKLYFNSPRAKNVPPRINKNLKMGLRADKNVKNTM